MTTITGVLQKYAGIECGADPRHAAAGVTEQVLLKRTRTLQFL